MRQRRPPLTRAWVEQQTTTSRRDGTVPDFSGAEFAGDWSGVDFTGGAYDGAFNSKILGADFRKTRLVGARFTQVDLAGANLRGADLTDADLTGTNLYNVLLEHARLHNTDLRGANLYNAELNDALLDEARFSGARFGRTSLAGLDLSKAAELDQVLHIAPSLIDATALQLTANGLSRATDSRRSEILRFLSNIGLPEDILSVVRGWIGSAIEFYSVFLSHSSVDKVFCRRLYQDLRTLGVNCWYDEHQILPGDSILDAVDRGIRIWDKLIFVASANSLSARTGWWVEQELERALQKEREVRRSRGIRTSLVIPITIDESIFGDWDSPHRATLIERRVADFRNWQEPAVYAEALESLVKALGARGHLTPARGA
jgi:hypothetical protein